MKEWINKHCTLKHILLKECTHIINMKPPKVESEKKTYKLISGSHAYTPVPFQKQHCRNLILKIWVKTSICFLSFLNGVSFAHLVSISSMDSTNPGEDIERDKAKQNLLECCQRCLLVRLNKKSRTFIELLLSDLLDTTNFLYFSIKGQIE